MHRLSLALLAGAAALLAGCATRPVNDGELAIPADYKSWPKFLSAVQRPDAKQVREIYMNPAAAQAKAGQPFPDGTVFVMENYGVLESTDGKLMKADLLRVFVMGKNPGWGQATPEAMRNGSWVYASYLASGAKGPEDTNTCRACHLPLAAKDFVHRYDEHFAQKK